MRWLSRIGLLLGFALLCAVAWTVLGSDTASDRAPPAVEYSRDGAGEPEEPPGRNVDRLPTRHRVATDGWTDLGDDPGAESATAVTGVVLDDRADEVVPIAGATVRFYVDGDDLTAAPDALTTTVVEARAMAVTGSDGRFSFDVERGAWWRLWVTTADGRATHARGDGPQDAGEIYVYQLASSVITVTDEQDQPLADALAYLYFSTLDTLSFGVAHCGADGSIALDPAPGRVVVTAPGHGFAEIGNPEGDMRVALPLGVDMAGVVIDDAGAPLAGVQLSIDDDGPDRTLRTDAEGRFRFERVGAQDEVYVWVHEGARKVMRILGYGDLDARIVIPRRGDIAGVVVYADGSPAADAHVQDRPVDREGRFVIWTDGRDRSQTLTAIVSARVPPFGRPVPTHRASLRVELTPSKTTDVRLVLEESPRSFLRLRVVAPDGTALHGSNVVLPGVWHCVQHSGATTLVAVGAAPGTSLDGIIYASRSQYLPHRGPLVTSALCDEVPTEIRLRGAGPALLRVFAPDGDEIERGEWTLVHVAGGTLLGSGRIDAPPGAWLRVLLEARGRRFEDAVQMPSDGSDEVRVHFPRAARVTGRLVRGDGTPARELDVVVVPHASVGSGAACRTTSDGDGSFAIDEVPTGRALFVVWQSGGEAQAQRKVIEVPESGELDLGEMLAWDDVLLEGRVTVPRGESAAGIWVEVHWDEGRESAQAISRSDGSFEVRVPGAPDALVTARRAHRLFGLNAMDLTTTRRADIRLTRVGRVRVTVPEAWIENSFDVYILGPGGKGAWAPGCDWIDRGRVVIVEEVPSGACTLRIVPRDGEPVERTVQVTPGEETIVHFDR